METSLSPDIFEAQVSCNIFQERLLQSFLYLLTASGQNMLKTWQNHCFMISRSADVLTRGQDWASAPRSWSGSCLYSKLLCLAIRINDSNIYTCRSQLKRRCRNVMQCVLW